MVEHVALGIAAEVEICMVCEVYERLSVAHGKVLYREHVRAVATCKAVDHAHVHAAGVPLLAVGRGERQRQRVVADGRLPEAVRKADAPAVQRVLTIVAVKRVLLSVKRKAAARDAVADAPDERALVAVAADVAVKRIVAADNVAEPAVPVGNAQAHDRAAEVSYINIGAGRRREAVKRRRAPVRKRAEFAYGNAHFAS